MLLGSGSNSSGHTLAFSRVRPGSGTGVLSMAPAQSKASSASSGADPKSRSKALANSFKRENAKKKAAKEGRFDLSTPLLDDGSCTITLGSLMESEELGYEQAVEVMMRFRAEAEQPPAEADEGWELPKLSKAKKPAGKSASEKTACVAAGETAAPVDAEPASKKRKSVEEKDEQAKDAGKPMKAPKAKAKGKAKAKASGKKPPSDDPEEPLEETPEPAPKKKAKTKAPTDATSATSNTKPASSIKEREPEDDAAEAEPNPKPETKPKKSKKSKKGKGGNGSKKLRRLRATAALGEEGEEEGVEKDEELLSEGNHRPKVYTDEEIQAMIKEIDDQMDDPEDVDGSDKPKPAKPAVHHRRKSKGPPTEPPTSPKCKTPPPKPEAAAWPHDRQPTGPEEEALHGGWHLVDEMIVGFGCLSSDR